MIQATTNPSIPASPEFSRREVNQTLFLLLGGLMIWAWISQDLLAAVSKSFRPVFEGLPLLCLAVFFLQYRSRKAPRTHNFFLGLLFLIHLHILLSCLTAMEPLDLKHLIHGYRGTLITLYSYFFGCVIVEYFGKPRLFTVLVPFFILNLLVQLAQAGILFAHDSQYGLFGPSTNNLTGFFLNALILILAPQATGMMKRGILAALILSSLLCFAQASLLVLFATILVLVAGFYLLKPGNYLNKRYIGGILLVVLLTVGYIVTYPLYNGGTLYQRIDEALFSDYAHGYLSPEGLVVSHALAVYRIYQLPGFNPWMGSGPSTWGSKGAGRINGSLNRMYLPDWKMSGKKMSNESRMSYSSAATLLVETGVIGFILYLSIWYIPIFTLYHDLRKSTATNHFGTRMALCYIGFSIPYLLIFTQFHCVTLSAYFMAMLGAITQSSGVLDKTRIRFAMK